MGHFESAEEEGDAPEEETVSEERSFQGLSYRAKRLFMRVWSAVAVSFTAFTGIANASFIPEGWASPASWIILLLAAVLGALLPSIGFGLALVFFGIVLFVHEVYLVGILLIVAVVAWWVLSGRNGLEESFPVFSVPLLGSIGLIPWCRFWQARNCA